MKQNINVLVIDDNTAVTKDLEKYFSSHEVIKVLACTKDGEEGLNYILNNHYNIDVIVMDLLLPKLDGLYILQEMKNRGINKKVIVTTYFKDDSVIDEANSYGVDYFMIKPVNFLNLEKRIIALDLNSKNNNIYKLEAQITTLLHKLGIPSHIRGYQFIREGIMLVYKSGKNMTYITKDIYPEIAKKYNTTVTRVERAIRHAIEVSWVRGDMKIMDEIFGNSLDINRDKPTNSEYLTTLADIMKVKANLVNN